MSGQAKLTGALEQARVQAQQTLSQLTSVAVTGTDLELVALVFHGIQRYISNLDEYTKIWQAALAPPAVGALDERFKWTEALLGGSRKRCPIAFISGDVGVFCETCENMPARAMCVPCFEAGNHRGHAFLLTSMESGSCACGDASAWKRDSFCPSHPGLGLEEDPSLELDEWTKKTTGKAVSGMLASGLYFSTVNGEEAAVTVRQILTPLCVLVRANEGLRRVVCREFLRSSAVDCGSLASATVSAKTGVSYAKQVLGLEQTIGASHDVRSMWWTLMQLLGLETGFAGEFAPVLLHNYLALFLGRDDRGESATDVSDTATELLCRPDLAVGLVLNHRAVETLLSAQSVLLDAAMVAFVPEEVDAGPIHGLSITPESARALDAALSGNPGDEPITIHIAAAEESAAAATAAAAGRKILGVHSRGRQVEFALTETYRTFQLLLNLPGVLDAVASDVEPVWSGWLRLAAMAQCMNPHRRRLGENHVQLDSVGHDKAFTAVSYKLTTTLASLRAGVSRRARGKLADSSAAAGLERMVCASKAASDGWELRMGEWPAETPSFHCPLNRALAINLFDLLDVAARTAADVERVLTQVLPAKRDWERMIELPVRAKLFATEIDMGLWNRNGQHVSYEVGVYCTAHRGFLAAEIDTTALRLAALHPLNVSDKHADFFTTLSQLLGLDGYLSLRENSGSDSSNKEGDGDEEEGARMVAMLRIVVELMAQRSELSLDELGMEEFRMVSTLAFGGTTSEMLFGQSHPNISSTVPESVARLSRAAADGTLALAEDRWIEADLVCLVGLWRGLQWVEDNLWSHLSSRKLSLKDWWQCHAAAMPATKPQFISAFQNFISSDHLLGLVLVALLRPGDSVMDSKTLKLVVHIILRLSLPLGPLWRDNSCNRSQPSPVQLPCLTIDACAAVFKSAKWCHPWTAQVTHGGRTVSIYSLVTDLLDKETSGETKQWLELVVEKISGQCGQTRAPRAPTPPPEDAKSLKAKQMQAALMKRLNVKQQAFMKYTRTTSVGSGGARSMSRDASVDETAGGGCVACRTVTTESCLDMAYVCNSATRVFYPRRFIPVEQAVLTPSPPPAVYLPLEGSDGGGHSFLRSCGHQIHRSCFLKLTKEAVAKPSGMAECPYCKRPGNVVMARAGAPNIGRAHVDAIQAISGELQIQMKEKEDVVVMPVIRGQIEQLCLSHRRPSEETDVVSLELGLELLLHLFRSAVGKPFLESIANTAPQLTPRVVALHALGRGVEPIFASDFAATMTKMRNTVLRVVGPSAETETVERITELAMLPWLYTAHILWRYVIGPDHELPFEYLLALEPDLTPTTEFAILCESFPVKLDMTPVPTADCLYELPVYVFGTVLSGIAPEHLELFLKRDPGTHAIACGQFKFVTHWPGLIPVLPRVKGELELAIVRSRCVRCRQNATFDLCLLCGRVVCLADCCMPNETIELVDHCGKWATGCAHRGVGLAMRAGTSEVHLVAKLPSRTLLDFSRELYTCQELQQAAGVRPWFLNLPRLQRLTHELREHSWFWRASTKPHHWTSRTLM